MCLTFKISEGASGRDWGAAIFSKQHPGVKAHTFIELKLLSTTAHNCSKGNSDPYFIKT